MTTVPPQALAMMNSPFVRQLAEKFAARVWPSRETPITDAVTNAYWIALSRPPTEAELASMTNLVDRQVVSYGSTDEARVLAVSDFCQLLLCLNEFAFVD